MTNSVVLSMQCYLRLAALKPCTKTKVCIPLTSYTFLVLRTLASHWNKEKCRCYEAKIEVAGDRTQDTWLVQPVLCHWATSGQPPVHIEDCEGWWLHVRLSSCCSSVAEHWLHKPGVLGSIPGDCQPFHLPLFSPHNIYISLYIFGSRLSIQHSYTELQVTLTVWWSHWSAHLGRGLLTGSIPNASTALQRQERFFTIPHNVCQRICMVFLAPTQFK